MYIVSKSTKYKYRRTTFPHLVRAFSTPDEVKFSAKVHKLSLRDLPLYSQDVKNKNKGEKK